MSLFNTPQERGLSTRAIHAGQHTDPVTGAVTTQDPHQAFMVLRGIKTLPLRVRAAQANAAKVARVLEEHVAVAWVRYPGLESHPQCAVALRQQDGPGSLIAFELKGGIEAGRRLMNAVRLAKLAVSLGGVETLIQHPASMTHAGMHRDARRSAGITDGLVRLAVGCEDYEDILGDLSGALAMA